MGEFLAEAYYRKYLEDCEKIEQEKENIEKLKKYKEETYGYKKENETEKRQKNLFQNRG